MTADRGGGYWARLARAGAPGEPATTPGQYATALTTTAVVVALVSAWAVWNYAFDGTRQVADAVVAVAGRNAYVQAVAGAAWCGAGLLLLAQRRRLPPAARGVAVFVGIAVLVSCWLVVPVGQRHSVSGPPPVSPADDLPGCATGILLALLVWAVVHALRRRGRGRR